MKYIVKHTKEDPKIVFYDRSGKGFINGVSENNIISCTNVEYIVSLKTARIFITLHKKDFDVKNIG